MMGARAQGVRGDRANASIGAHPLYELCARSVQAGGLASRPHIRT